jgi:hypothetical protein
MSADLKAQLNLETAQIAWSELELFFASGKAIFVDASLDMIDVACAIHLDRAEQIKDWMNQELIGQVPDKQAQAWVSDNATVWAVVIRPWVLVQSANKDA